MSENKTSITSIANFGNELRWGTMREVIGPKRMSSQLEQIKYGIRFFLSRNSRSKFLLRVSASDFGRTLFESTPTNFYVPLRSYLDNRFTVRERFEVCLKDIETAKHKFGAQLANKLLEGGSITLSEIQPFSVELQMNRVSQHEGFWGIIIKDQEGKAISNLSFGFLDSKTILIASIQGFKDSLRNIPELNKQLTKQAFGLRPQNLLVVSLQALCEAWQIESLIGIDPKNQVKRKINTERQGFKFDYSAFWSELGASKNFSGYWTLSNRIPIKSLVDVPSHKRNQYRKRNELVASICGNAMKIFCTS